jgi:predicted SprT family Zn-dependent metalloprotease
MRRFDISVGLLSLAAISSSAGYAVSRERFHDTDLPALYQRINTESFNGALPPAEVRWATLDNMYGETEGHDQWFVIEIDRDKVQNDGKLVEIIRHEICHVATMDEQRDAHGELWQACMERFKHRENHPPLISLEFNAF